MEQKERGKQGPREESGRKNEGGLPQDKTGSQKREQLGDKLQNNSEKEGEHFLAVSATLFSLSFECNPGKQRRCV